MKPHLVIVGLALVMSAGWPAGGGPARTGARTAIPAGFDLFETVRGTQFEFDATHPIPAGFFEPGSEPFSGVIKFGGVPLDRRTLPAWMTQGIC